jgi:hypothetical protein
MRVETIQVRNTVDRNVDRDSTPAAAFCCSFSPTSATIRRAMDLLISLIVAALDRGGIVTAFKASIFVSDSMVNRKLVRFSLNSTGYDISMEKPRERISRRSEGTTTKPYSHTLSLNSE